MAEATKVILEALVNSNVINLDDLPVSSPWYSSYLQVAQNITPYLTSQGQTPQNFILTPAEASQPNKLISREEFAVIAFRVLQVRNCIELNKSSAANQQNQTESNTSQTVANPNISNESGLNTSSNQASIPVNAGLYLDQLTCISCPCQYRYEYLATIRKNDKIYMLIRDPETGKILQKSSELVVN